MDVVLTPQGELPNSQQFKQLKPLIDLPEVHDAKHTYAPYKQISADSTAIQ